MFNHRAFFQSRYSNLKVFYEIGSLTAKFSLSLTISHEFAIIGKSCVTSFVEMSVADDGFERVPDEKNGGAVQLVDVVKFVDLKWP